MKETSLVFGWRDSWRLSHLPPRTGVQSPRFEKFCRRTSEFRPTRPTPLVSAAPPNRVHRPWQTTSDSYNWLARTLATISELMQLTQQSQRDILSTKSARASPQPPLYPYPRDAQCRTNPLLNNRCFCTSGSEGQLVSGADRVAPSTRIEPNSVDIHLRFTPDSRRSTLTHPMQETGVSFSNAEVADSHPNCVRRQNLATSHPDMLVRTKPPVSAEQSVRRSPPV